MIMNAKKIFLGLVALASIGTGAARNAAAPAAFPVAELGGRKVMGEDNATKTMADYKKDIDFSGLTLKNRLDYDFDVATTGGYKGPHSSGIPVKGVPSTGPVVHPNFAGAIVNPESPRLQTVFQDDILNYVLNALHSSLPDVDFMSKSVIAFGCHSEYLDSDNSVRKCCGTHWCPGDCGEEYFSKYFSGKEWIETPDGHTLFLLPLGATLEAAIDGGMDFDTYVKKFIKEITLGMRGIFEDLLNDPSMASCSVLNAAFYSINSTLKSGETKDLYYYIPTIPTVDNILTGLSAKDLFGEDCTVTCTDTEKAKLQNKIGTYDVQVNASDSYGQTATATLRIHVCDINAPTVSLKSGESLVYGFGRDQLVFADLDKKFAVADDGTDYGGGIGKVSYTLDGTALAADKTFAVADVGTHKLVVTVSDSSGNKTDTTFTLTVVDVFSPIIQRADGSAMDTVVKVGLSESFSFGKVDFLNFFVGQDDVDGVVACALEGDYIPHQVGSYTLKVSATDKAGNKATADVPVQVIQDLPPVFILSQTLVEATTSRPLTTAEITAVVTNGILSGEQVKSVSVDASAYVGSEDKVGTYPVTYTALVEGSDVKKAAGSTSETRNGTFMIKVNDAASLTGDNATHWYDGIVKFFKGIGKFFQKVGNFFRGKGWKTNEELGSLVPDSSSK